MNRICIACLLSLVLVACNNENDEAVEYLKAQIGYPSSFKLINIESQYVDESFDVINVYHIVVATSEDATYDCYREYKRIKYAHTIYFVDYEVKNNQGKIVRKSTVINHYYGGYTLDDELLYDDSKTVFITEKEEYGGFNKDQLYGCKLKEGCWYRSIYRSTEEMHPGEFCDYYDDKYLWVEVQI